MPFKLKDSKILIETCLILLHILFDKEHQKNPVCDSTVYKIIEFLDKQSSQVFLCTYIPLSKTMYAKNVSIYFWQKIVCTYTRSKNKRVWSEKIGKNPKKFQKPKSCRQLP